MRLSVGYVPLWREDMMRFFSGAPHDLALFLYILSNAQYDKPYPAWVDGLNYSKEHTIQIGEILTSKVQLAEFGGIHHQTVKKVLERLVSKGLIEIVLEQPALIIKIVNHSYFTYAGKQAKRPTCEFTPRQVSPTFHQPFTDLSPRRGETVVKRDDNVRRKNQERRIKNEESIEQIYVPGSSEPTAGVTPSSSILKSKTHSEIPKRNRTWEGSDPFAAVFASMTKLSICHAKFDTEDYRLWLTGVMEEMSVTIDELAKLANAWQEYHNERTTKPKVAKASFRTWIGNYTKRRGQDGTRARKQKHNTPAEITDWGDCNKPF